MWMVYDWSDGLIGLYDTKEDALDTYNEYKGLNVRVFDGEFYGDEEVILAKVEKRFRASQTDKPVLRNGKPTGDMYWDWKTENY